MFGDYEPYSKRIGAKKMNKTYIAFCPNCKKQQPCYIKLQPTRRTKCLLNCSRCGKDIQRRIAFNRLVEYEPTEATNEKM